MNNNIIKRWRRGSLLLGLPAAVVAFALFYMAGSTQSTETDSDNDGMSDAYEMFFGLNPTNPADAAWNNDDDSLNNLAESVLLTDPFAGDTDRDGFKDGSDSNAVSRAYILWGDPQFTSGDQYDYAHPAWLMGAYKVDGEWTNNPVAWHVPPSESEGVGSLNVDLDRVILTNDLVCRLRFFDHADASLYMDLLDTNENVVAGDLFGNLHSGSNAEAVVYLNIPLQTHADAAVIHLRRGLGEVAVYESLLYVDTDGDGLDADQEAQAGTSDYTADSDSDGLTDYGEVFTYGTDPRHADTDGDGMPDGWEIAHGLNPLVNGAALDPDNDGLNNLQEYQYGTDPHNADTDSDGMSDGDEVRYGNSPTGSNVFASLPFTEMFETNTVQVGQLHGQNNWSAWPVNCAFVQTNTVYDGEQALSLKGGFESDTLVRQLFVCTNRVIWLDAAILTTPSATPPGIVDAAATWFFNNDGRLVVFDGLAGENGAWVTITNHAPFTTSQWVRAEAQLDYGAQRWRLFLNNVMVADNLGFSASASDRFTALEIQGQEGYADNITLSFTPPETLVADTDGDGLPDWWELANGLDPNNPSDASADPDNDGLTNLQEYQYWTDPHNPDTDGDGLNDGDELVVYGTNPLSADTDGDGYSDGTEVQWGTDPASASSFPRYAISGVLSYAGPQTGTIYVALTTNGFVNGAVEWREMLEPGVYAFSDVPALKEYWIGAWRDSDGNGSNDFWEAQGWSASNPVYLAGNVTDADIALSDPDTETDGLPDWWEMKWFGSLDYGAGDDPDNDGVANLQEYQYGTDPYNWDTDGDVLSDGADPAPLSRAAMYWGRTQLWKDGFYSYPGPAWFRGGMQTNGQFRVYNGVWACWYGNAWNPTNQSALLIGVDRNILTNDAWIKVASVYGCALQADLLDADGTCLMTNVCGNLAPASMISPWRKAVVPLEDYPSACWIRLLSSGSGPAYVNSTFLYVDRDGNGIDEENELANGTSDLPTNRLAEIEGELAPCMDENDWNMFIQESQMALAQSIPGRTNSACTGAWVEDGDGLWCCRRGIVEYTFNAPTSDIYRGTFFVREQNPVSGRQKNFDLRFTVDGEYVRRQTASVVGAATGTVTVWTPWLPAGAHRIAMLFDNADTNATLRIERLDIARYAAADTNGNGVTEWAEGVLAARNGVDVAPEASVVSPVCVEGTGRYLGLMSVAGSTNALMRGANWRWYLNVDLPETGTNVDLEFSFENGALQETRQLRWEPLNLAEAPSNCILRTGDKLKLTVNDGQTNAAQITVNGVVLGEVLPGEYLIQEFSTAGVYQVETSGGLAQYALTVKVLPLLTNQTIVAWSGRFRDWPAPLCDDDAVWQWDSRLAVTSRMQVTNLWEWKGWTVAPPLPEEYAGVARAGASGPVLGQALVKGLRLWGGGPSRMWRDSLSEEGTYGSWMVTELVIQSPVVAEAAVRSDIAAAGTTFPDGSRTAVLSPGDFDPLGQANLFYFNQSSIGTYVCHYLKLFQGDYFIGEQ